MGEEDRCYFLDDKTYDCMLKKIRLKKPRVPCVAARLISGNPDEAEHMIFDKETAERECLCFTNDENLGKQLEGMFKGVPFGGIDSR